MSCKPTYKGTRYESLEQIEKIVSEEIKDINGNISSFDMPLISDDVGTPLHRPKENKYDKVLFRLESERQLLVERFREDSSREAELRPMITRLEEQIETLGNAKNELTLINISREQLNSALAMIKRYDPIINTKLQTLSPEEILNLMERVEELGIYINGWTSFNKYVSAEPGTKKYEDVSKILVDAKYLAEEVLKMKRALLARYASFESFKAEFTEQELFGYAADTKTLMAQMINSSLSSDMLVKAVSDILQMAKSKIRREHLRDTKIIESFIERNRVLTGKIGEDAWDWMVQKDNDGNRTGRFIGEYSYAFDLFLRELNKKRNEGAISWETFWGVLDEEVNYITEEEITSGKSSAFTQEEIEKQRELLRKYEGDRIAYIQLLEDENVLNVKLQDGKPVREDKSSLSKEENDALWNRFVLTYNKWVDTHSPYVIFDVKAGKRSYKAGRRGFEYIIPYRPKDKWKDPRYAAFSKEQRALYDDVMNIMAKYNGMLPKTRLKGKYYIPETSEKRTFWEMIKDAPDVIKNAISEEDISLFDPAMRFEDDDMIREIQHIPIKMLGGRISPENKSYDLGKVLLLYSQMALSYNYKSKIEVFANTGLDMLKQKKQGGLNAQETAYRTDKTGNIAFADKRVENSVKQLSYVIDAMLYDRSKKKMETPTERRVFSSEDKEKLEALGLTITQAAAQMRKLSKDLKRGKITYNEYKAAMRVFEGIGKVVTVGKIVDTALTFTYVKALSLPNVVAPAVNMGFGLLTNIVYAAGGIDFNTPTAFKGMAIMTKAMLGRPKNDAEKGDVHKIYAWLNEIGLFGEINESRYGEKQDWTSKVTFLQMWAEKMNQGSAMIAMLLYNKIKGVNGNEISLWDAYTTDENGLLVWDEEKMGPQGEISPNSAFNEKSNGVNIYRLGEYIKAVVERIHGDYNHPLMIKKTAWGRAMMLFRTWLPQTLYERIGKETYDYRLGRLRKGRYRSYKATSEQGEDIGLLKTILKTVARIAYLGNNFKDYSAVDRENLRRNVAELRTIILLSMVMLLLRGLADGGDDDDEAKAAMITLANTHGKIMADMLFFLNPKSADQIVKNSIPLWGMVEDLYSIIPATVKTIQGHPEYENGPWKGTNRYWKWLMINLPFSSAAARMWNYKSQIYDFN